jgi:intracellular sulfur oxidation DsrE/DsrF family protein
MLENVIWMEKRNLNDSDLAVEELKQFVQVCSSCMMALKMASDDVLFKTKEFEFDPFMLENVIWIEKRNRNDSDLAVEELEQFVQVCSSYMMALKMASDHESLCRKYWCS